MIFTECVYCSGDIIYPYEAGDPNTGKIASVRCRKCDKLNFIELWTMGAETMDEEYFWKKYPDAKKDEPSTPH